MASDDVQTNLRLPSELKDALVAAAARNNRSLSAEVAFRLVHSFAQDSSVLHEGERAELWREKQQLALLKETILTGVEMQRTALVVIKDRLISGVGQLAHEQVQALAGEESRIRETIAEALARVRGINGRIREIDADLQLPDLPDSLVRLANERPR